MEEIDRLANRVSLAGLSGVLFGASQALYKGNPVLRPAVLSGMSCAMVGTLCFGFERTSSLAMRYTMKDKMSATNQVLASHVFGGVTGGALVGLMFHQRPLPAMLLFTPIMALWGMGENKYQAMREERLKELSSKEQSQTEES